MLQTAVTEMLKPEKLIYVGCRVPESLDAKLEKAAKGDRRTKAAYLRILIEDALRRTEEPKSATA